MLKIFALALSLVLMASTNVYAAKQTTGMTQTSYTRSIGYESGLITSRTPADCYATDDWSQAFYSGSLKPGETYSVNLNFCYRSGVVLPDGVIISGTYESIKAQLYGAANVQITTQKLTRYGIADTTARKGYQVACSRYNDRIADSYGWWGGPVTVTVSNPTTRTLRDITLLLVVNLDYAQFC